MRCLRHLYVKGFPNSANIIPGKHLVWPFSRLLMSCLRPPGLMFVFVSWLPFRDIIALHNEVVFSTTQVVWQPKFDSDLLPFLQF
jgi:hypothetical protein